MLNILMECCKNKKYVAVYTNTSDSSKFIFGRIISVNTNNIAIYMLSPDGYFDGVVVKQIDDVLRVEIDGQYSEKMQKLQSLYNQKPFEYVLDDENIPESLLLIAQQLKQVVAIEIMQSGFDNIVGFVEQIENNLCGIKQIDSYGYEDGISYVRLDEITQISCNSQDESRILKLWELNREYTEKCKEN